MSSNALSDAPNVLTTNDANRRGDRAVGWMITLAWVLNVALFVGVSAWIFLDPGFMRPREALTISPMPDVDGSQVRRRSFEINPRILQGESMSDGRMVVLTWVTGAILSTLAAVALGLFIGAARHRRIRSWLALTALVAAWLALWSSWPQLAWAGAKHRVSGQLDAFEAVAVPLREHWPTQDGANPQLGPYSAYPHGRPRTLMLLAPRSTAGAATFSTVERSAAGALRFELLGSEQGSWLEWHPEGWQPASFTGGLETRYDLTRSSPLGGGWFLTRYREGFGGSTSDAI